MVYPIKSCRGISVSEAPLSSTGFRWDRLWAVVNSKGRVYTQRVEPRLALVRVDLPPEAFSTNATADSSYLVIRTAGVGDVLNIPVAVGGREGGGVAVTVWEWSGPAVDEGDEAAAWFSRFLGKPSRLVRFDEATQCRRVNSDYAPGHTVKFNDLYPFLLLSQASLDFLNDHLPQPVPMNRFRPNIVVDGCEPFAEDLWNEIEINGLTFRGGELCYRCKIPTVDQETAVEGTEPNATLIKFRSDKILRPDKEKHRGRVYMGQLLVCTNFTPGSRPLAIRVGDPLHVLKQVSYTDCLI